MGNHQAGRAMGGAAEAWWAERGDKPPPSKDEALAALDLICEPYRRCDAEFEASDPKHPNQVHPDYQDYRDPAGPLGRLMAIAFDATPEQIADFDDGDGEMWYEEITVPFSTRYDLR